MVRLSRDDRIFDIINTTLLFLLLIAIIYPLIYIISSSFSSANAVVSGRVVLFPVEFSIRGYKLVFQNPTIWIGYKNSLLYAFLGTSINLIVTIMAAYPLSRHDFKARSFFIALFVFTMFFSGGLIPTYVLVNALGLIDTVWVMVIPNAMGVWYVIIMRTYFQTSIPRDLLEAAQMDGCSDFYFLFRVVLPLSKPIIAVISLFYAVNHWNTYFHALIYLNSSELYPLQIVLRNILILNQFDQSALEHMTNVERMEKMQNIQDIMKYSLIIVASVPVLILYPFVQRFFVKGVMIGSLKG